MISRFGSQTALEVRRLADPRVVVIAWRTVSDVYGGSNSVSVFTTATTVVQVGGGKMQESCQETTRRIKSKCTFRAEAGFYIRSLCFQPTACSRSVRSGAANAKLHRAA